MVAVVTVVAEATVVAVVAAAFCWSLLYAKRCYMPHLLAAPTARTSSFHNHHHLPLSADDNLGDGLEVLPQQTKSKSIVPVSRPGSWPEKVNFLNASISAEESGQYLSGDKRRDFAYRYPGHTGS